MSQTAAQAAHPGHVAPAPAPRGAGLSGRTRLGLGAAALVALAAVAFFGLRWWTHGRFVQATNDAYLRADVVTVAPKVGGFVDAVYVADNQAVAQGAPLVRIRAADYDAAVGREAASLQARRADALASRSQIGEQQAAVAQAEAQEEGAGSAARFAAREAARFRTLADQGVETAERAAQARNQEAQAQASLKASTAALQAARRRVGGLAAQAAQAAAGVEAQAAALRTARLNLGDTLLRASQAGRIGDRTVRPGQLVQPGQRLMSVVPVSDVYLVANFKETQIGRMRVGQKATVRVDALGGERIDAVLDSFAPGTGAQFALLPPENATGNFTKIVQRVPVRFRLRPTPAVRDRLLPGLSAKVEVDTTQSPDAAR